MNILHDDVLGALGQVKTLSLNYALATDANNALVASDLKGRHTSLVVCNLSRDHIAAGAAERADIALATTRNGTGLLVTPCGCGRALGADKVEGLVDENNTGRAVGEPGSESG